MAGLVGEAYDFVFDGGTISRADALNATRIHGRLVEIVADDFGGVFVGPSDPTVKLAVDAVENGTGRVFAFGVADIAGDYAGMFHVEQVVFPIGEPRRRIIAGLFLGF